MKLKLQISHCARRWQQLLGTHWRRLVLGAVFAYVASLYGMGQFLLFSVPFFLLRLLWVTGIPRRPFLSSLPSLSRTVIYVIVLTIPLVIQIHRAQNIQVKADELVALVNLYRGSHAGKFPADARAGGFENLQNPGLLSYDLIVRADQPPYPYLRFRSTFVPFERHIYDFELKTWHTVGD